MLYNEIYLNWPGSPLLRNSGSEFRKSPDILISPAGVSLREMKKTEILNFTFHFIFITMLVTAAVTCQGRLMLNSLIVL